MTSISLDISGKVEPHIVELLKTVSEVLAELEIPYVVVGAYARDLVLHYGYGADIQRATDDVDFAIEVPDWNAFSVIKDALIEKGFGTTKRQHRLISSADTVIDIVPFGSIEDEQANIAWPPSGEVKMNVLGFNEACDNAEWIKIQTKPELNIPVATPIGMSLLKIIAWTDRYSDLRKKDAKDIVYLLSTYEIIPEVTDTLYKDTQIIETYDWDITQAAACLLGQRARKIAKENTVKVIESLVKEEYKKLNLDLLVEEMCVYIDNEFDRKSQLLSAFIDGFNNP